MNGRAVAGAIVQTPVAALNPGSVVGMLKRIWSGLAGVSVPSEFTWPIALRSEPAAVLSPVLMTVKTWLSRLRASRASSGLAARAILACRFERSRAGAMSRRSAGS